MQKNKSIKTKTFYFSAAIIFIALLIGINNIFKEESIYVYKWYFMLLLIGIPFIPITNIIFKNFNDKGYFFSKTIGMAITSMIFLWFSSLKIFKFTNLNCLIVYFITAFIIFILSKIFKKEQYKNDENSIKIIIIEEILFLLLLIILMYIKGFRSEAYGTEKFMDYGFMSSMMITDYFPVEDFWFSGESLNYYYIGQYIATYLTKISINKVEYTYNLMIMTICALTCIMAFSITYNILIKTLSNHKIKKCIPFAIIGGVISSIAICFMGNMHYVLYYLVFPFLKNKFNIELSGDKESYWFPDSTRFIGYNPIRDDKTIHEFPSYSFILGDLHAHVINIIFVITIIGILVAFAINKENKNSFFTRNNINIKSLKSDLKYWLKELFSLEMILCGFFIGLFQGTNYWDFPIYFVVAGAIILFTYYKKYGFSLNTTLFTLVQGLIILTIATVVILPFSLNFVPMESGIKFTDRHTLLNQWIILWGFPVLTSIIIIIDSIKDYILEKKQNIAKDKKITTKLSIKKIIDQFFEKIDISDLIIITIACCAIGLLFVSEVIYVKDIYGDIYQRSNTMFKTVYQSFIMFGFVIGYGIIKLFNIYSNKIKKLISILILFTTLVCSNYFLTSCEMWFGDVTKTENYKTINALSHINTKTEFKYDKIIIEYINENIKGNPIILESNGLSYTAYNRISVSTGKPTVLGWRTHEWLWRNNLEIVTDRGNEIQLIYISNDPHLIASLINKYNIEYIYIGILEYDKYSEENIMRSRQAMEQFCDIEIMISEEETELYDVILYKVNQEKLNEFLHERSQN